MEIDPRRIAPSARPDWTDYHWSIAVVSLTTLTRHAVSVGVVLMMAATASANTLSEKETARARQLVRQLGSPNYRQREEARSELIRMGSAVESVLREGMTFPDPEVRFRSRTILPLAMTFDLERRLQVFLARKESKDNPAPPAWDRFKELVGDTTASRELFTSMHRYDTALLAGLEKDPAAQRDKMAARCMDFMQSRNNGANAVAPTEQIALMLFACLDPRLKLEPNSQSYFSSALHSLSYQPRGKDVLKNNEIIRKLLVKYITESSTYTAYNSLYLVANLELKEGVEIARSFLKKADRDPHTRGMALSILGKIGSKENIPEILAYLNDTAAMGETQFGNGQRIKTQMRDVALATLIQLTGQNLHDYDFAYLKMFNNRNVNLNLHLSPSLLGFADDAIRDKAMKKWNEYYEKNKANLVRK